MTWSALHSAVVLCVVCVSCGAATVTNSWAVQVTSGGREAADALASKYGFVNLGLIGNLDNIYHFQKPVSEQLQMDVDSDAFLMDDSVTQQLEDEEGVVFAKQQEKRQRFKRGGYQVPNDVEWPDQWSLDNRGQIHPEDVGNDIKAEQVWLQGVTGCGTVVGVVDDGVEYTNSDLIWNYVESIGYDALEGDFDPFPEDLGGERENHGTNCAGEIAMEKGNGICGVGMAYNSFITGIRLISGVEGATDIEEAEALSWQNNNIDIYSCSWGPSDSGDIVEGPSLVTLQAMKEGVTSGRQGKGSIFLFASGNGGDVGDSCAADNYVSSRYTIGVGSVSNDGTQSWYDEQCSGKMVVVFTDDPYVFPYQDVVTLNTYDSCHTDFIGTSASAPLAAGAVALLLEVNPDLTWRDVQYLLAYTSNPDRLVDGEWSTNGAGLRVSHKFGFGAVDAEALVSRGRHWINVPAQKVTVRKKRKSFSVRGGQSSSIRMRVRDSADVKFLETVEVIFSMTISESGDRGKIAVHLTSPSGTESILMPTREFDTGPGSFDLWTLMSVHFWGEDPTGRWRLTVHNDNPKARANVEISDVLFYGTSQVPEAVARIPEECSSECDPGRGCAASGAEFCDACRELRVASTLECTSTCPEGLTERNGYCYDDSVEETSCVVGEPAMAPLQADSAVATAMRKMMYN